MNNVPVCFDRGTYFVLTLWQALNKQFAVTFLFRFVLLKCEICVAY